MNPRTAARIKDFIERHVVEMGTPWSDQMFAGVTFVELVTILIETQPSIDQQPRTELWQYEGPDYKRRWPTAKI